MIREGECGRMRIGERSGKGVIAEEQGSAKGMREYSGKVGRGS